MQEIFKQMIEKLNGLAIRTDEPIYPEENKYAMYPSDKISDYYIKLSETIEVIKQVAKQYNNKWIPCSERLPKEPEITGDVEEDICNGKLTEYLVMIYGAEKPTTLYYAGERYWYDEVSQDYYPVIAWQSMPKIPELYQKE